MKAWTNPKGKIHQAIKKNPHNGETNKQTKGLIPRAGHQFNWQLKNLHCAIVYKEVI